MLKKNKKQFYLALVIVLILFILSFVFMYFFYNFGSKKSDLQDVLEIDFISKNDIKIKNILPVGDKLGKTLNGQGTEDGVQGFVEFSINNPSDKKVSFEIYLSKKDSSTKSIPDSFIKCFLTDENDEALAGFSGNMILTYVNLAVINDKANSKLLYRGSINSKSKEQFKFRAWLADTYVISQEPEEFNFTVGVRMI